MGLSCRRHSFTPVCNPSGGPPFAEGAHYASFARKTQRSRRLHVQVTEGCQCDLSAQMHKIPADGYRQSTADVSGCLAVVFCGSTLDVSSDVESGKRTQTPGGSWLLCGGFRYCKSGALGVLLPSFDSILPQSCCPACEQISRHARNCLPQVHFEPFTVSKSLDYISTANAISCISHLYNTP